MLELSSTVDLMLSKDYKERFKAEYWQTAIRYTKLLVMTIRYDLDLLDFVPTCPIDLYKDQLVNMERYLTVLRKRAEIENIDLGLKANEKD